MDNVDLIAWIATRAHGPNDVVYVGRVDVIVHDDGPAIAISPSVAMRCHHASLFGVSAVELLDGHRQHETASAGLVRPHAFNLGDACGFKLIPDCAASINAEVEGVVVWRHRRNSSHQNWIVPMHHRGDADCGLGMTAGRVVTVHSPSGPSDNLSFGWMKPSKAISEFAGTGSPVRGMLITSTGSPRIPPAASISFLPYGISNPASMNIAGCMPTTTATGQGRFRS